MGRGRGACRVLVGRPEGKSLLGNQRLRWEDNIKTDHRQMGWGHKLDQCGSEQGQVLGSSECGNKPSSSIRRTECPD